MQVRHKELYVETTGSDGPTVVAVHGLGGTTNFWEPVTADLATAYRVVRYDFDGHGRSPLTGPVSVTELAEDLAAVIEQTGGPAHVLGHSMGTLVVQQLAATRPELVTSIALLGPVRAQPDAAKEATRARAATVRAHGMAAVADTIVGAATSPAAREKHPAVGALVRELLLGQDAEAYAQACEALAAAESPDLGAITCPVLLLTGTDDKVSPPATSEAMAAELKDATTAVTSDCGHWTAVEAPAFVTHQLRAFLNQA
jgi:pimeloyl-ACP methyl ester carboxylesterase